MQRKIDLHLHTDFSDGTLSPEQLVREAQKNGISVISICDHDCIDGIEPALQAARQYSLKVIPGVEVTCEIDSIEVHVLGYFIDYKDKKFTQALATIRESREKRIYDMVDKLKGFDINVQPEDVFALSKDGSVGRPHLARVLVEKGFVGSFDEAFRKYLGDGAPCYVSKFNLSPPEAIKLILEARGIPVYAHPKVVGRDGLIPGFINAGLRGIEAYHTDHAPSVASYYVDLARKNGLLVTGGSDFHGSVKREAVMGGVNIPYYVIEELEKEAEKIRP